MDMMITMIIVWAVVIAMALLIEFLTYSMVTTWFAAGGVIALITAPCGLYYPWQILIFFVVSLSCLLFLRKYAVKLMHTKTTPTNLDINIGKQFKLLKDVKDGRSEIKINDIIWTVACDAELKTGEMVRVSDMAGNKYIVEEVKK